MGRTRFDDDIEDKYSRSPKYFPGDVVLYKNNRYVVLNATYSVSKFDWVYRIYPEGGSSRNSKEVFGTDLK